MRRPEGPFNIVIPARYGSSRLPGKPLRLLGGLPMIRHVHDRACEAGAERIVVATDDERILRAVREFGGEALMTAQSHQSGTDRLAEVSNQLGWSDETVVVNLQGDEPCMPPQLLNAVADALYQHEEAAMATLAVRISTAEDLFDPNVVKVVVERTGLAMYFSRAPIPYARDAFANDKSTLPPNSSFLRHLGIYAYRASTLRSIAATPIATTESLESLEQLRPMSLGMRIHVNVIDTAPGHGVDTEADLTRVEAELLSRNLGNVQ